MVLFPVHPTLRPRALTRPPEDAPARPRRPRVADVLRGMYARLDEDVDDLSP